MVSAAMSIIVVFVLLQMVDARPEVVSSESNATSSVVFNYISLETSCTSDTLLVLSTLNEPFFGSVYAKGFSDTPQCVASGSGGKFLRLSVDATECGIRVVELEDDKRQFELTIYVQFDHHVQQVVDDQMHIKCVLPALQKSEASLAGVALHEAENATRLKVSSSTSGLVTSISRDAAQQLTKNARFTDPIVEAPVLPRPTTLKPFGLSSSFQVKKVNLTRGQASKVGTGSPPTSVGTTEASTVRKRQQQLEQQEPISCWLDIFAGKDPSQGAVKDYLYVGQDATLLVKVRQAAGFDTRLIDCIAHDGTYETVQELINSDGCSVDASLVSHIQERYNPRTGVKLMHTTFQAFKFPEKEHLHIKCSVAVCRGRCPARSCLVTKKRGRDYKPESQGTGQVRPLSVDELEDSNRIRPVARLRNNDRALGDSNVGYRAVDDMRKINQSRNSSSLSYGAIIDRVEIFNSVEVRAPTFDEGKAVPEYILSTTESTSQLTADAMFCVTPSKLFLAFGVLLGILVVAMLLAICFCIKGRSRRFKYGQKLNYGTTASVAPSGRTTPNPMANLRTCSYPRPLNNNVSNPNNNTATGNPRLPRGYVVSRTSSNPYMGMYQ